MTTDERIAALHQLGEYLLRNPDDPKTVSAIARTYGANAWLTPENCRFAIEAIASSWLREDALKRWLSGYPTLWPAPSVPMRRVALVMAGNLPLVGMHDWLCAWLCGHEVLVKLSDKDSYLLPHLLKLLPVSADALRTEWVTQVKLPEAVIATGSNNTGRYFEAYFGRYPHVIRRNRNSVAVLWGNETVADFHRLGADVFRYFGLGCRSVSLLCVPYGYDFSQMLGVFDEYRHLMEHDKYRNNYDYNRALLLLNRQPHLANDCLMLVEDEALSSRMASLHYWCYRDVAELRQWLCVHREEIQCVASGVPIEGIDVPVVPLGQTQRPELGDYADGVDTLSFLLGL